MHALAVLFTVLFRLFLFGVGLLSVSIFLATDGLSRHVAWIVMERSFFFFARLFLVGILVIGHGILLRTQSPDNNAASDRLFGRAIGRIGTCGNTRLFGCWPSNACQFMEGSVGKEHRVAFALTGVSQVVAL
jgi:hypothetical protein